MNKIVSKFIRRVQNTVYVRVRRVLTELLCNLKRSVRKCLLQDRHNGLAWKMCAVKHNYVN